MGAGEFCINRGEMLVRLFSGLVWFRGRVVKTLFGVFGPIFQEVFRVRGFDSFYLFSCFYSVALKIGQLFYYAADYSCFLSHQQKLGRFKVLIVLVFIFAYTLFNFFLKLMAFSFLFFDVALQLMSSIVAAESQKLYYSRERSRIDSAVVFQLFPRLLYA